MPKITQDALTTSATPRRRSARQTKMPPSYNPSDDSDEEYDGPSAGKTKDKARSQRKRKHEKDEEVPSVASKKTREETFQSGDLCPLCNKRELVFEDEANFNYMGIKHHLIKHYLENTNRFSEEKILVPTDPDEEGKPKNSMDKKYKCKYHRCGAKRSMGYKEMAMHYATQHQELKNLLSTDNNKKLQIISTLLYGKKEQEDPVAVKDEKIEANENIENEEEDVDDPAAPTPPPKVPADASLQLKSEVKVPLLSSSMPRPIQVRVAKIKNCPLCSAKKGRNESDVDFIKSHLSPCIYVKNGYIPFLPHKQGDHIVKCEDILDDKRRFKYFCPYGPDNGPHMINGEAANECFKFGDKKPMGYKEFSIHMGSVHGVMERWAELNNREVFEMLRAEREEKGGELPETFEYRVEEFHICLLCNGDEMDKSSNLGFDDPDKIRTTKFHYANCLFLQSPKLYYVQYPHKQKENENGDPEDIMGGKFKYPCEEKGCTNRRQEGYKSYVIHKAKDHNGLLKLIANHENPKVRTVVNRLFDDK